MRRTFGRAARDITGALMVALLVAVLPGIASADDETTTESTTETTTEETITVVPTVDTPEDDYAAGSDALIIGDGWASGEEVTVIITDDDGDEHVNTTVTADENGHFELVFTLADYFVPTYDVVAIGVSGTATTSFTDVATFSLTNNATGGSDRLYEEGQTLKLAGNADFDTTKWYRFRVVRPNSSVAYLSSGCLTQAQVQAGETYTLPAGAMLSPATLWSAQIGKYNDSSCTSISKDPDFSISFNVVKVFAFASATDRSDCHVAAVTFVPDAGCTNDDVTLFAPATTPYVRVLGLRGSITEVSTTWRNPSNTVRCANTTSSPAGDRPDSNAAGELDTQYIPISPEVTVPVACPVTLASEVGNWRLEVGHSTFGVSHTFNPAFSVGNSPPVAVDDDASGTEDTLLTIAHATLLSNDTDADLDTLELTAVSPLTGGSVVIDGTDVKFTPTANLCGSNVATFEYTVSDGTDTDDGVVTIDLTCVNDDPVAVDDDASGTEDTVLTIAKATLLANDTDVDLDTLTLTAVGSPSVGAVIIDGTNVKFTPTANLCGTDVATFEYTVSDGTATDTGLVTVDLTCVNDAPGITLQATASGQYSDNLATVNISATDVDNLASELEFSNSDSCATVAWELPGTLILTDNGNGTATITGQLTVKAGTYIVCIVVSDGTASTTDTIAITINSEDATVTPRSTNPAAIQSGSTGLAAGGLVLFFDVQEKNPPGDLPTALADEGDIDNAGLTVKLTPLSGGSPYTLTCTAASPADNGETGYDEINYFRCTNSTTLPVNTYEVEAGIACISGNCFYKGVGWDAFTVYNPTAGFATGGGYIMLPTKNGSPEKVNFGFTMKYNKSLTNLQGNFIAIRHHADGTVSRMKSNSLGGLVVTNGPPCGVATFNGKATYTTWDPAANGGLGAYVGTGNNSFAIYAQDCNNPGTGVDSLWMFAPGVLNMSTPAGTVATDKVALSGGNIAVPHRLR